MATTGADLPIGRCGAGWARSRVHTGRPEAAPVMPCARGDSSGRSAAPASLCPTRLLPHRRSPSPHRHAHGDGPLRLPAQVGRHGARHAALRLPRRPSHATARHERRFYRVRRLSRYKRGIKRYCIPYILVARESGLGVSGLGLSLGLAYLTIGHGRVRSAPGAGFSQRLARYPLPAFFCLVFFCALRVCSCGARVVTKAGMKSGPEITVL